MRLRTLMGALLALATAAATSTAQVPLGNFDPVEETGWGYWGELTSSLEYPLSDGDEMEVSTEEATTGTSSVKMGADGYMNALAYDATEGGTLADFASNDTFAFDVIFKTDTSPNGGYQKIEQVIFNYDGGWTSLPGSEIFHGWVASADPKVSTMPVSLNYSSLGLTASPPTYMEVVFTINNGVDDTTEEAIFIDNVRLYTADPYAPIAEVTGVTSESYTWGTFSDAGVFDNSGENIVINADPSAASGPNGGVGYGVSQLDFDAFDYALEVDAKLLSGNTANQFRVLLTDEDGGDMSDDTVFLIDTNNFNTTDFSTLTIPLGTGSEFSFETTYDKEPGDNIQNFGLTQIAIQSSGADPGIFNMEIASVRIVPYDRVAGDFDGDGDVDIADLMKWQQGQSPTPLSPEDLAEWQTSFTGSAVAEIASVPEPGSFVLFCGVLAASGLRRRGIVC